MENTLKETEWLTINKVLLEMYDITDIDQFTERVLKTYRMLIPYTKGYFIVFNEAGGIESEKSSFIEMEPGVYEEYLDSYYEKDYMKYTFDLPAPDPPSISCNDIIILISVHIFIQ